ncbi:MAG: TolC family protein [Trueperaceae bacterium]
MNILLKHILKTCFLTSLIAGFVSTQHLVHAQDLITFLAAVKKNPAITANQQLVAAAEAQLAAVYSPISGTVQGNYTGASYTLPNGLPEEVTKMLPDQTGGFSIGATLRPFVFGDIADLAQRQRIALEQTKLTYQQTLADLEVQALEAAANVQIAQAALELAQTAKDLAQSALDSTETRFTKGGATEAEVRAAEESLRSAEHQVQTAEAGVALAQQSLELIVGGVTLEILPQLPLIEGTPPDVKQAEYNISLAKLGMTTSNRAFVPTAQASLAVPLNDEKSEFDFSIESRTLQPTITYKYDNPKGSVGLGVPIPSVDGFPELGGDDINVVFSVGISATISVEQFSNLDAAKAQLAAAEAGLVGARDRALLTALSLNNTYQTATSNLELAKLTLSNTESALRETNSRAEAGLAIPLESDQATLAVTQAKLGVFTAEIDVLKAILATYTSYATPISETLERVSTSEESQ